MSAAALWGIRGERPHSPIHVSVRGRAGDSREGLIIHRRNEVNRSHRDGIPVTTPTDTIIDLAAGATGRQIEADINEAAKLGIATPA
ncbi:MAG: hypothetical protein ACJ76Z_07190 [Thermoleophilaceae bacterium]